MVLAPISVHAYEGYHETVDKVDNLN